MNPEYMARGSKPRRLVSTLFLLPAWFAPHKGLRVLFHRMRGVKIGKNVEIGYFCIIGNVHPYLITIEDGAIISAGSAILEHDNAHYYSHEGRVSFGPVVIRKKAFIGVHTVVMPNVTIGERAIVAANSLVLRNVLSDTVVGGVPAQFIIKHSA